MVLKVINMQRFQSWLMESLNIIQEEDKEAPY